MHHASVDFPALLLAASLAGLAAYDIACTKAGAPVRYVVHRLSRRWYVDLIDCHYCLSHYTAAVVCAWTGQCVHLGTAWVNYAVQWALIVALASPIMVLLDFGTDAVGMLAHCKDRMRVPGPGSGNGTGHLQTRDNDRDRDKEVPPWNR